MLVLLVAVAVMLGSASKLQTPRTITLSGDVTGSTSFDGSKNVSITTQLANVAVLTGTITAEASKSGTANINYPAGFNADNCVPICFGVKIIENRGFNYFGTYEDSADLLNNSYERKLNLNSTNIVAVVKNPTTSSNSIKYKIVLMKV